ncbi:GyrI-like domain-containing protein [Niallia taxi]|nr:GyrI-like domain-containing protein [Niallia taxi]
MTDDKEVKLRGMSGGKYAVFKITHTAEAVQRAWDEVFLVLDAFGFKLDKTRPVLERYSMELVERHYCELCVPVR